MRIEMWQLKPVTVDWRRRASQDGSLPRFRVAQQLCKPDDWRNPRGQLCVSSAAKALPAPARQLGLPLPAPRNQRPAWSLADRRPRPQIAAPQLVECRPRGLGLAPGTRLTYLLECPSRGMLGGLSYVASAWRCQARDQAIGWSERAPCCMSQCLDGEWGDDSA